MVDRTVSNIAKRVLYERLRSMIPSVEEINRVAKRPVSEEEYERIALAFNDITERLAEQYKGN